VTRGKYDVVVTTGPAYASKRAEAADRLTELVSRFPALQQLGGDLVLKALDVPYADKLADRLAMTLPPGFDEEADKKRAEMEQKTGPAATVTRTNSRASRSAETPASGAGDAGQARIQAKEADSASR
jgi:hypothetical protein